MSVEIGSHDGRAVVGRSPVASSVSQLQDAFVAALRDPESPPPDAVTSHTARQPGRRFAIYRNNVYSSLAKALAAKFPVIERLLGPVFFAGVAREFIDRCPPRSPVLIEFGAGFAAFLEGFEPVAELAYLADVARLEWLQHEAYHAADAEPLALALLQQIAPEQLATMRVGLHPSLRLMSSPYPVLAIWRTNSRDSDVERINLQAGGDDLMIVRPELDVLLRRLRPGELVFLDQLAAGETLAAAAGHAISDATGFDLQLALATLLTSRIVTSFDTG